jgi:hypothetical protein
VVRELTSAGEFTSRKTPVSVVFVGDPGSAARKPIISSWLDSSALPGETGGDSQPLRSFQHCWSKGYESSSPLLLGNFYTDTSLWDAPWSFGLWDDSEHILPWLSFLFPLLIYFPFLAAALSCPHPLECCLAKSHFIGTKIWTPVILGLLSFSTCHTKSSPVVYVARRNKSWTRAEQ